MQSLEHEHHHCLLDLLMQIKIYLNHAWLPAADRPCALHQKKQMPPNIGLWQNGIGLKHKNCSINYKLIVQILIRF